MDKITAVELAAAYIEKQGFELITQSGQSEARYLKRPGVADRLRVAAHACHHSFGVAANLTIDYRETWERDEKRVAWIRSEADLYRACDDLIAEYDNNAEDEEAE